MLKLKLLPPGSSGRRVVVGHHGAGTESDCSESGEVAVLGGDFAYLLGADEGANNVRVGLDGKRIGRDSDRLSHAAYRQSYVGPHSLRDIHFQPLGEIGLKALHGYLKSVSANIQPRNTVYASGVGYGTADETRGIRSNRYLGTRNCCPFFIGYGSGYH